MVTQFWKNYDSKSSYDGYISDDSKIRKHAKIISGILERNGKKKLQEIEKNCQSTISARGINFRVYAANNRAEEKKWPLDIIPRIIPKRVCCLLYTSPSQRDVEESTNTSFSWKKK